jgi:hypothetical protein
MGIALLVIGACEIALGGFCLIAGSPRYSREMNRAAKYAGWIGALLLLVAIILLANGGYDQIPGAIERIARWLHR